MERCLDISPQLPIQLNSLCSACLIQPFTAALITRACLVGQLHVRDYCLAHPNMYYRGKCSRSLSPIGQYAPW